MSYLPLVSGLHQVLLRFGKARDVGELHGGKIKKSSQMNEDLLLRFYSESYSFLVCSGASAFTSPCFLFL